MTTKCSLECAGAFCGRCKYTKPPIEHIKRHEFEVGKRIALAKKLKVLPHTLVPTEENGLDDANFVNGRPEVKPDGTIDTCAVFFQPQDTVEDRIHKQIQSQTDSWTCRCPCKCGATIYSAPRTFIPSKTRKTEPLDWYWCMDCKVSKKCHDLKPNAKQLREQQIAEKCASMNTFLTAYNPCTTP